MSGCSIKIKEIRTMSHKLFTVMMLIAMLLSACAPAATPQPIATAAPKAVPTVEPTLAPTTVPTEPPAPTSAPVPEPIKLTDGLGRSIELASPAQRIISIAPSNTEILFALGAGQQVIGREEMSDYPSEAKDVASIGSVFQKMNTEAIVALDPDLILAAEINSPEQVKALEDLKLTVYYLPNPKTIDDLYANLETVGKLTGRSVEAAKLNETLKARYDAVIKKVADATEKPSVFYEIDATDPTALHQRPRHVHRSGNQPGGRAKRGRQLERRVRADQFGRTGEAESCHHRVGRCVVWSDTRIRRATTRLECAGRGEEQSSLCL
jgi:iron complex transport system substrate-binding protein